MKTFVRAAISAVVLGVVPMIAGCQSSGNQSVDKTSTRMTELRANVETLKTQIAASAASLAGVVETADADPKPQYDKFVKDAKAVESSFNAVQSRLSAARGEAEKLFREWAENAKTITDPDLQKLSEERRAHLNETLEHVIKPTQDAVDETKEFVARQTDLVKYLGQDLTPAGIHGIEGKSKAQTKAANSIAEKLDEVVEAASKASSEFATAKPPPKANP